MTNDVTQGIPSAYELKRLVALNRPPFWRASFLSGLAAAPIYVFPDQDEFDGEDVGFLTRKMGAAQLRLPHSEVIFEVIDAHGFATECWPRCAAGIWPTCRPSTYGLPG